MSNHDNKHDEKKHSHEHNNKKHEDEKTVENTEQMKSNESDAVDFEVKVPDPELVKALEKVAELSAQVVTNNDKYLRLMAEFDNFKRRTAKEYQQLIEQANEKLMKDILDVRETFERAVKSHSDDADPAPFIEGMKMLFTKLDNVLHKHGLEVYCEVGQLFDPEFHDAMMKSVHETVPEEHVSEVLEKGYKLKGKVIKHSRVIVSSGKPAPVVKEEPKQEPKQDEGKQDESDDEAVFEIDLDKK
jgi:molecular chaperone GrpE